MDSDSEVDIGGLFEWTVTLDLPCTRTDHGRTRTAGADAGRTDKLQEQTKLIDGQTDAEWVERKEGRKPAASCFPYFRQDFWFCNFQGGTSFWGNKFLQKNRYFPVQDERVDRLDTHINYRWRQYKMYERDFSSAMMSNPKLAVCRVKVNQKGSGHQFDHFLARPWKFCSVLCLFSAHTYNISIYYFAIFCWHQEWLTARPLQADLHGRRIAVATHAKCQWFWEFLNLVMTLKKKSHFS